MWASFLKLSCFLGLSGNTSLMWGELCLWVRYWFTAFVKEEANKLATLQLYVASCTMLIKSWLHLHRTLQWPWQQSNCTLSHGLWQMWKSQVVLKPPPISAVTISVSKLVINPFTHIIQVHSKQTSSCYSTNTQSTKVQPLGILDIGTVSHRGIYS